MRRLTLTAAVCASTLLTGPASAAGPVVVELFTSQSCSSCPPAEALLRKLSADPGLLVLEWHVDYWNRINAGAAGRWKDPFSAPAHTARQRDYNLALRRTESVYTPQTVVMGTTETVGSREPQVRALIDRAKASPSAATVAAERDGKEVRFAIAGAPPGAQALLVSFRKSAATRVKGGENSGLDLAEANVVNAFARLGAVTGKAFSAPAPASGDGCALLVEAAGGTILAGAYCP